MDVRIISATNENIEKAMQGQKLREDLYYRLNVINIHLPPLRERKEDIRLLAEVFLKKFAGRMGKNITGFEEDVIEHFESYKWQGNIRELENVVERAVTLSKGDVITMAELPANIFPETAAAISFDNMKFTDAKQIAIEDVEKKYLMHLLNKHNGNITKMSEEAGMTRRNIHRMLNNHNINTNDWRS